MNCEQALALVSAAIDGEIEPGDRTELDRHLSGCATCRELRASLQSQELTLRRAFEPRRVAAAAVAERVIARLPGAAPVVARRPLWLPMLLSAAAGFLIATLVFRPWQRASDQLTQAPDGAATAVRPDPHKLATSAPQRGSPDTQPELIPRAKKTAAELVVAMGAIMMLPPGGSTWEEMKTGAAVELGTRVRTGPEGRCELRTVDGSDVRMNVNTELVFHTNRKLELAGGRVWSAVAPSDVRYDVLVPSAAVTIAALGTQFDIECKPDETLLTVVEGITTVEGKFGQEAVEVHAHEAAKIVGGWVEGKQHVHDLVLATSWVHEILKLKGAENAELRKRMDDLFAQIGQSKIDHMYEKEIIALGDHCVVPLTRFIQSERSAGDKYKRVRAADILAQVAPPWSIPDLIDLLADREGAVRYHAAAALRRLTGETHGLAPDGWQEGSDEVRTRARQQWLEWWTKHRDKYPKNPFGLDSSEEFRP